VSSFDPPPEPCRCGSPLCNCGACHGVGWVWVGAAYAQRVVPDLTLEQAAAVAAAGPEAQAAVDRQQNLLRSFASASTYPCRACNQTLFYRWRDGHYGNSDDHNPLTCTGCQDEPLRRRRRVSA
jgi:hypothetical protein